FGTALPSLTVSSAKAGAGASVAATDAPRKFLREMRLIEILPSSNLRLLTYGRDSAVAGARLAPDSCRINAVAAVGWRLTVSKSRSAVASCTARVQKLPALADSFRE